jgi:glutaredoxin
MAMKNPVYLLVEKNNVECSRAERLLRKSGIHYKTIDVDESNIGPYMWRDFRTHKLPLLVTLDKIIENMDEMKSYIRKISR